MRGEIIGALGIHDDDETRQWTADEIALIEAIAERMALAAENLRLLDETQRNAARAQLISDVTDKMRRAVNMDDLIQTTIREVAATLNATKAFVQLSALPGSAGDEGSEKGWPLAERE